MKKVCAHVCMRTDIEPATDPLRMEKLATLPRARARPFLCYTSSNTHTHTKGLSSSRVSMSVCVSSNELYTIRH